MGYGGDLMWSGVFRALAAHDGRPVAVANTPRLSDLLAGRLYDRAASFSDRPVFSGNPRVTFFAAAPKWRLTRLLDTGFAGFLKLLALRRIYERAVMKLAAWRAKAGEPRIVHVDMLIHSYAARETKQRFIWKTGGHAIATILRGFGVMPDAVAPELYLETAEEARARDALGQAGVTGAYVVFEPDSNREWFGELRSWPHERWVALVKALHEARPGVAFVQVGLPNSPKIPLAIDLRGRTTFREAAAIIKTGALFIGTEGGLMHAARAVDAKALILWGGVTLPEFAGYPDRHTIVCHYVSCAPCGQFGWCDNGHICMRSISVDEVARAALAYLH